VLHRYANTYSLHCLAIQIFYR